MIECRIPANRCKCCTNINLICRMTTWTYTLYIIITLNRAVSPLKEELLNLCVSLCCKMVTYPSAGVINGANQPVQYSLCAMVDIHLVAECFHFICRACEEQFTCHFIQLCTCVHIGVKMMAHAFMFI